MDPQEALAQLTEQIGPVSPETVACGIVVGTWRDAAEPLHQHLTDPQMAYMNIATTRAIASACDAQHVDWDAVTRTLLDPDRVVLPGRSAKQVAGEQWHQLHLDIAERLQDAVRLPPVAHAGWALIVCANWWGMPAYPEQVARLVRTGRVTLWPGSDDELAAALLTDPLSVPVQVWAQIVGGNGFGWLER